MGPGDDQPGPEGTDPALEDDAPDIDHAMAPNSSRDIAAPHLAPYDPAKARELVRGSVVGALLALLAFVVIGPMVAIWFGHSYDDMQGFVTLVFGSLSSLVGAAVGFYFGERRR
jgi:hypothetical protein